MASIKELKKEVHKKEIEKTQQVLNHIDKKEDIKILINDHINMWNKAEEYKNYPQNIKNKIIKYILKQKQKNNFGNCKKCKNNLH